VFNEFERFAVDAYEWDQEAEIPPTVSSLHDWWFRQNSKQSARALGSSYSENFLCKIAVNSSALNFLEMVNLDEFLAIRDESFALTLRRDLELCRADVRRSRPESLLGAVNTLGEYISGRLRDFETEKNHMARTRSIAVAKEAGKFAVTAGLTFASAAFPPLSLLSFAWGSSVSDVVKAEKRRRLESEELNKRPMASLVTWQNRANELKHSEAVLSGK
jgi:hypothetical protein